MYNTKPAHLHSTGSSGSGKTTFLNHVHDLHKCTYIRQYHTLRPYIPVRKIPDFDPTQLPYWSLYSQKTLKGSDAKNVSYNPDVKISGTMAGELQLATARVQSFVCSSVSGSSPRCLSSPPRGFTG